MFDKVKVHVMTTGAVSYFVCLLWTTL